MSKKVALIFGGTRGIGAATVEALVNDGFEVALTYVSSEPEARENVKAYKADVTVPAEVAQVFENVKNDFGSAPSCVIANAGINVPPGPVASFDPENFRKVVDVNIVGAFNVLQKAAQEVLDGGNIIALTTSMVRMAIPGVSAYTATKAAVEVMIRSMSKELAPRKVRVNAVAPGPVDTDLFRAGKDEAAVQRSAGMSPFNRVGQPEEIANVISFLVSDKASWVHGQIVQPNGGMV